MPRSGAARPDLNTVQWRDARTAALHRARHRCERCGSERHLNVHHIDEGRSRYGQWNLEVLCRSCHLRRHRQTPPPPHLGEWQAHVEGLERRALRD